MTDSKTSGIRSKAFDGRSAVALTPVPGSSFDKGRKGVPITLVPTTVKAPAETPPPAKKS
jgi:hypothetical protein